MGIRGLMTYMMHSSSMKKHKLRKTRVIIDASNLVFFIYDEHKLIWKFGGEYESFDNVLVNFFERLKLCELVPFMIFDGCYDIEVIQWI